MQELRSFFPNYGIVSISASSLHSSIVTTSGDVYSWGYNGVGQVRPNGNEVELKPVRVPLPSPVRMVSNGGYYSAAVTVDGSLLIWGDNSVEQLSLPGPVRMISSAWYHTAIVLVNGDLYIWSLGLDRDYRLTIKSGTLKKVDLPPVRMVSSAKFDTGVVTLAGRVYELTVVGSNIISTQPVPYPVSSVSYGDYHSAITRDDGSVVMLGSNQSGQLGSDETAVRDVRINFSDPVYKVSLGDEHSAAVTVKGRLYMWGRSQYGQVGNGTTVDQAYPVPIPLPMPVRLVSAGTGYTIASTVNGIVYAWGNGEGGKLGTGNNDTQVRPVQCYPPLPGAPGLWSRIKRYFVPQ